MSRSIFDPEENRNSKYKSIQPFKKYIYQDLCTTCIVYVCREIMSVKTAHITIITLDNNNKFYTG